MARTDSIGMFWIDAPTSRKRGDIVRPRPAVPETGWKAPTEFPNLSAAVVLSLDTETWDPDLETSGPGWARNRGHVVGFSVGAKDAQGNIGSWYFPIRHADTPEENVDAANALAWLKSVMETPDIPKVGANLIYDIGWLQHEGIMVQGPLFDVQHAEALLDERARVGLDVLANKYLGQHKQSDLLYQWCSDFYGGAANDRQRKNIWRSPPSLVGPYGESDASLPLSIMEAQWPLLEKEGLLDLFHLECELIPLLVAMRYAGVPVDIARCEQLYSDFGDEVVVLEKQLADLVGFGVNVNSADDLARAFDREGIPYSRTAATERSPDGNPSFTAGFLETVNHPLGKLIVDIRQREKLRSVFIKSYLLDNHVNGIVHGSFNQLRGDKSGTRSGRFSSDSPNLQNIPVRSELGKVIRRAFADKYRPWRKYDYSQIEYRCLAHYAVGPGSDALRGIYNSDPNTDYHNLVHKLILEMTGIDLQRSYVKNANFGFIYGMGEPTLAAQLGINMKSAKDLFAAYHKGAPYVKPTMEATIKEASMYGVITTVLGRRSRFDMWEPASFSRKGPPLPYERAMQQYGQVKRAYAHKALNRRLQGSAADLMKKAMVQCWKEGVFDVTGVPRLTVHDELDFIDNGGTDEAFDYMQHVMETCLPLRVPIRADCEIGPNWGDVAAP